jgi:hypothetical protein
MSSLSGEQALKGGLSFEFTWAARHLLEVMAEQAEAITLGGLPGEKGVDFRLHFADHEEHHQVKRAFGTKGDWTLAALDSKKVSVLTDFKQRLADPKVHCFLASGIPAVCLGYLANRARDSSDFATFEASYLTGDYVAEFDDLVSRWELSREECWVRLQRVHTRPFDEQDLTSCSLTMLRSLVMEGAEHAWTHLRDFCFDYVHQRVTASEVWQWLAKRGIQRQIVNDDPRVLARLAAQTRQYLDGVRQKLIKPPLPRQVASVIVRSMEDSVWGEDIVVLGSPGGGKSAVMLQIAEACLEKGWPTLAFRLDDLPATLSARQLQEFLDLPLSPAACLARASAGKPALVIIDQLDAVSQYSGRTGSLFDRIASFVDELRAHRLRNPIHLVIACREVDWKHDGRFRPLHRPHSVNKEEGIHKVESLTDDEIRSILASSGLDAATFSPRQREQLLRRPQYLALLIETNPDASALKGIVTPKHLFDAYWSKKQCDLALALPSLVGNPWFEILKYIADKLAETALTLAPQASMSGDGEAPLAVTRSSLDKFPPPVINWMLTNGVLSEGNRRIRFGHESFFDYCFARFFEERGQSILEYLLESEQTLIQRGQLRQVLAYQRDEDIETYLTSVRELLTCDQIRPHLKHLLISVLCEVPDPKESEWALIAPKIVEALADIEKGETTSVSCQVFFAFHNSLPLFKMSCEKGAFADWLQNSGPTAIERLFRVLLKHQENAQHDVWLLIEPIIPDERYHTQLDWLSHFCRASDSRETFEWLLSVMRRLYASDEKRPSQWDRFHSLTEDLAKNKPQWLAEWLAAVMQERAKRQSDHSYELLRAEDISAEKIGPAIDRAPRAFLDYVLPAVQDAIKVGHVGYFGSWSEYDRESNSGLRYVSPDEALFAALINSLHQMLQMDSEYALRTLDQLKDSDLAAMKKLHAAVLCNDDELCTPLAANYLAFHPTAFSVTYKGKLAACEMLKIHVSRLSDVQLAAIESAILQCWPKHQNKRQESYGTDSPKTCLGNWRGYQQMQLLRAIPKERLSNAARSRLEESERKFDSVNVLYGPPRRDTPIKKEAIVAWKPERFLQGIVSRQKRIPRSWRERTDHEGKVSSILTEVVAKRPSEFIRFLSFCDPSTPKAFLDAVDSGLMNLELDSELALEAARQFHRLGPSWSWRTVRMLEKVKPGVHLLEAFKLALDYAINGQGVSGERHAEDGKRGERLHGMAMNCSRGQAIGALRQMLWANPELLEELRPYLPDMMSDPCPAIRTELASLCYAIAFKEENRAYATELFLRLVSDQLPDEHVLTSRWPFKFMHVGLVDSWSSFEPILIDMMASGSSEVRGTAARLICIAVISGVDAIHLAERCVSSEDPKVRTACADVLSHNLDVQNGKPWSLEALLKLADDPDKEVCRATGFGYGRAKKLDFGPLSDFLISYVKTRAFVRGASRLIDAIVESRSVLPTTIFDLIETFIDRLHEPVEQDSDRLSWHIDQVSPVLTRLYHENRDGALRKRALDLIDKLCVNGSVSHESLDQ